MVSPGVLSGAGLATKEGVEWLGGEKVRAGEGAVDWFAGRIPADDATVEPWIILPREGGRLGR
jgi:hypothetical protein